MPTEEDYHLEPQSGPLSKVICDHCTQEIGEVYTATQTPTGTKAGPTEEELTLNLRDLVRNHLAQCHAGEPSDEATYENRLPNHPPEKAPFKKQPLR